MKDLNIKIINQSSNPLPAYATAGSSGMDLRANIKESISLKPLERKLIPTGLFMEIPLGFEGQVRPRSGMAVNKGITCLNTPGTIDSDYRGEVKVLLINLSGEEQVIEAGDRIAQIVFVKIEIADVELVQQLNQTERAAGGFGHTGIQ
ncbi:MAG: dUTP diphosphatase [Chitinophagaceae bacterium]|nr:MAG: dUTP diphosphatase [Chitinophagaceae bacterium]